MRLRGEGRWGGGAEAGGEGDAGKRWGGKRWGGAGGGWVLFRFACASVRCGWVLLGDEWDEWDETGEGGGAVSKLPSSLFCLRRRIGSKQETVQTTQSERCCRILHICAPGVHVNGPRLSLTLHRGRRRTVTVSWRNFIEAVGCPGERNSRRLTMG